MSTKQERIAQHGRQLLAIYPNATDRDPVSLCKRLRRLEAEGGRFALRGCNGPEWPSEEAEEAAAEKILRKVDALLRFTEAGPTPFINRDPRGYALKIRDQDAKDLAIHKDLGGYGIIAPDLS